MKVPDAQRPACGTDPLEGARILRRGGLVAFPTETVYGLGGDARNLEAVRRIFAVKGRPAGHPLIVHLSSVDAVTEWAADWPEAADKLAAGFWPGPLTLILRKHTSVLPAVTGGQDSIGLRVPSHPLALNLLQFFGGGVAAPSANRFGHISPTTAQHVLDDLGDSVDYVLDGGPCQVGVESTILDLSTDEPVLLRPGSISGDEIERVLGRKLTATPASTRAPGALPQHYSPRARVVLAGEDELSRCAEREAAAGARVFVLSQTRPADLPLGVLWRELPLEASEAAHELYATLRSLDTEGADVVVACPPGAVGIGTAVADRLRRAAGLGNLPEAP